MCGIAALFGNNLSPTILNHIVPMSDAVLHRGPDSEGYVTFPHDITLTRSLTGRDAFPTTHPMQQPTSTDGGWGCLGHRRLTILDISDLGLQPMCSRDRRFWITYNGEIYNFLELRRELEILGHEFSSKTDTEVILAAFQQWGADCLHRFNGMFSFVIVDVEKREVWAARDRFGVKPLYFWISPLEFIAIASEIKQFTVLPGWKAKANGQRVYDFLTWGVTDHTDETLFSGVTQLRGGEALHFTAATFTNPIVRQWYNLKPNPFTGSFEEASTTFAQLLESAVRIRLRADVEIGSCLSGGLDSSSIVCLMSQQKTLKKPKTFSACCEDHRLDERKYIDEVVNHCGTNPVYCYPSLTNLLYSQESLAWCMDEPYGSSSIYAQSEVFRLAKQHNIKVVLDGQGADEQLAGYHVYFAAAFREHLGCRKWGQIWRDLNGIRRHHGTSELLRALKSLLPKAIAQQVRKSRGVPHEGANWINLERLGAQDIAPFSIDECLHVTDLSYQQITRSHLPMLLRWEDRNSMSHSVESRTPFLDYRLVEFVTGLPTEYKLALGINKRILREGMKMALPEAIRNRKDKIGFATAEESWIKSNPNIFTKIVNQCFEDTQGSMTVNLQKNLHKMIEGRIPYSFLLWRVISYSDWLTKFQVRV